MVHIGHPQAPDGIAVIAGDPDGVSFVVVWNLVITDVITFVKRTHALTVVKLSTLMNA